VTRFEKRHPQGDNEQARPVREGSPQAENEAKGKEHGRPPEPITPRRWRKPAQEKDRQHEPTRHVLERIGVHDPDRIPTTQNPGRPFEEYPSGAVVHQIDRALEHRVRQARVHRDLRVPLPVISDGLGLLEVVDGPDLRQKPGMVQLAKLDKVGKPFSRNIIERHNPGKKRRNQAVGKAAKRACDGICVRGVRSHRGILSTLPATPAISRLKTVRPESRMQRLRSRGWSRCAAGQLVRGKHDE